MQFITNGPDIPNELLQAHEEGRVVFFCGAGISYPANLPSFKELVDKIYKHVGEVRDEFEKKAFDREQYDATLDLLERRIAGQRKGLPIRKALAKILQPNLRLSGATDTHAALLQLARSRDGDLRLVTTNFDRIFEKVAKRNKQSLGSFAAPMLPIPKNSRWNGIVYLHGLLPDKPDDSALNRLVLTSGDFGLAYLTERWAARFVSELFRNYVVCFVGYSINDPVMRYMMDALAADKMLGEQTPQAYALGDYEPGQEHGKNIEWEAKGVTPILYEVPTGSHDHSALHRTLKTWAETYRDGILGKERIVVSHALARPSVSTQQDDFVGRMLWALSDKSGLPAKQFADFNPVPSLEWLLEAFSEERYRHGDLIRYGVPPLNEVDEKRRFSLIRRPSPYNLASPMMLVSWSATDGQWDLVMFQLARWLVRHLNDPALVIWLVQRGGRLHDSWPWLIEDRLNEFARLESEGKTAELTELIANAPNAIPGPLMKTLWRLMLADRVKSPRHQTDLYRWKDRLKRDGMTTTLRLELRELLSPKVKLEKPFQWGEESESTDEPTGINQLVNWELVLVADNVKSALIDETDQSWLAVLPELLNDFQQLLRDALDLLHELGGANNLSDRSIWDLPSISQHRQNRGFRDWVALIELLRDSWLSVRNIDNVRATKIALEWFEIPFPTFKRLAFFAASQDDCIASEYWVNWLLADGCRWLWSIDTRREVLRLLVLQGRHMNRQIQDHLESTILAGPPREKYQYELDPDRLANRIERDVWLYLAKLSTSGLNLGDGARDRLAELSTTNPQWQLEANESDEFAHWMSGSDDPDYEDMRDVDICPRKRNELVLWLKKPKPERRPFYEDTWREVCRTRFFHSLLALNELAQDGLWPAERWSDALQAWSEEDRVRRSWRFSALLVNSMPDTLLKEIAHSISWWLEAVSKSIDQHEAILIALCHRILLLPSQDGVDTEQSIMRAINHPIGHVTQAVLNLWFKREPNDNDTLPNDIEPFFTQLCDTSKNEFLNGRVMLTSRLIALFRVDRTWTEKHLLPLLDWTTYPTEAKALWQGFLWSPRRYSPLMIAFKPQFLATALHYEQLGEQGHQFAAFLTYAGLEPMEGYSSQDFQTAIGALPQKGLQESAQALAQALESSGEQCEDYWRNRIWPFWQNIWPKSQNRTSKRIAQSLARLSIAARGEFPVALASVQDWLQPIDDPYYVVHLFYESKLCSRFPEDALLLLNALIEDQHWAPKVLGQCLDEIIQASPRLVQDTRYLRLREYFRKRGI